MEFGSYKPLRLLGKGGFAEVYEYVRFVKCMIS